MMAKWDRSIGRPEPIEALNRIHERENGEDRSGDAIGVLAFLVRDERGVDGNERRRENAFAEQRLQQIRDSERRAEGVCLVRDAEIESEDPLPNEPDYSTEQDTGKDQGCRPLVGH